MTTFWVAALIAVVSTVKVITELNAVRALLDLIVSLLAVAVIFFTLGAPFAAALEVIIYAGAIMVLFVFVIMMLNLGPVTVRQEREWLKPGSWISPSVLSLILLVEILRSLHGVRSAPAVVVGPESVGAALYGPYVLAVELASLLLLTGLVGAYHLGRRTVVEIERKGAIP